MEKKLKVVEVMRRHAKAMSSMDADYIASDYAEDAVLICNMADSPAVGRAQIRQMIDQILHSELMNHIAAHPDRLTGDDEVTDIACGEYCLHIFSNRSMGMSGVESYQVRNNKIIFESAALRKL